MPITSRFAAAAARAYGMFSNLARAVDPFFNYVTALLHGDGTNGAQNNTFLDSSTNNFTITRNGNTTQGTFSPFSQTGWSNYFDGSSYLSVSAQTALSFGTGDFTVEAWVYPTAVPGTYWPIIDARSGAVAAPWAFGLRPIGGVLKIEFFDGTQIDGASSVPINTWTHIAFSRSGTTLRGFVNGILDVSVTNSTSVNAGTTTQRIGGLVDPYYGTGYISNCRVVKGTAVYTAAFTPSTTPLTAISGTSLLTCQANRFFDASSNGFAITVGGSPSVQAFSPFNPTSAWSASSNGGSAYFDGSGDYLQVADAAAMELGSGNWTIEMWVNTVNNTQYSALFTRDDGGTTAGSYVILLNTTAANGIVTFWSVDINSFSAAVLSSGTTSCRDGAWHHIAVVRNGNTLTMYIDGVSKSTATYSGAFGNTAQPVKIGSHTGYSRDYTGFMADVRLVVGTAVYTANFTPPTAPLTAVTNTQLLLNCTNAGIYDNAADSDFETVGTAQVNTTVKKYGTGSIYCNGTGNYLSYPSRPQFDFGTGDFTIECWVYVTSVATTYQCICQFGDAATTTGFHLLANTNTICLRTNSSQPITTGAVIAANTWYHVALSRVASQTRIFVNGTASGSTYNWTASLSSGSTRLIGADIYANPLTGYIDDFRITKGVGRYIYNFTPPAAALPDIGGTVTLTADPYYNYTTLLLPGNGTNGAQNNTFLDSSSNAFTITRNGNTTQGNFSPFSQTGWGAYFDGSSAWLSVASNAAFGMGTGDATLECWYYPTNSTVGIQTLIDIRTTNTGVPVVIGVLASGAPYAYNGTTYSGGTVANNYWNHIAFVRSGGGSNNCKLYLNGTQVVQFTDTADWGSADTCAIGRNTAFAGEYALGYISNVRVVKGTAVYTGNFTPSTTPLTAISGTSLLTCQSNRFLDNSSNAFAITVNGSPSVQAFSPFAPTAAWSASTNGGSGYYDGSGDYVTAPGTTQFAFGTGAWTVECWVYPLAYGGTIAGAQLFGTTNGATTGYSINLGQDINSFRLISNATGTWADNLTVSAGNGPTLNAWNHMVVVRSGANISIFKNGTRVATSASATSWNFTGTTGVVGRFNDGTYTRDFNGYLGDVRVVTGTAVYDPTQTTLTVPTTPLTAISGTSLLLSATNGAIVDATAKNDLETVGNAQISTTQSKFGGSSMAFDGSGDWLSSPDGQNYNLGSGDFTIECWVYVNNLTNNYWIISKRTDTATQYRWIVAGVNSSTGTLNVAVSTTGSSWAINTNTTSAITATTWNHIAFVRYGSDFSVYVNGIKNTLSSSLSGSIYSGTEALIIGAGGTTGAYVYSMNGYIDDLRITKGIARYTSNFTPPTSAFLTL